MGGSLKGNVPAAAGKAAAEQKPNRTEQGKTTV